MQPSRLSRGADCIPSLVQNLKKSQGARNEFLNTFWPNFVSGSVRDGYAARLPTAFHRLQLPPRLCLVDWNARRHVLLPLRRLLQAVLREEGGSQSGWSLIHYIKYSSSSIIAHSYICRRHVRGAISLEGIYLQFATAPELVLPIKETKRGNSEREKIHVSWIRLASVRFLERPRAVK